MRKPFDGNFPVTQRFGEKITDPAGHTGIDYALYLGTPVLAALEGKVVRTAYLGTGTSDRDRDGLCTPFFDRRFSRRDRPGRAGDRPQRQHRQLDRAAPAF